MLSQSPEERTFKSNFLLASVTALTAGMINMAGLLACFNVTANVTGHTAIFAQHMLQGKWFEMIITLSWIMVFALGAFVSNYLIKSFAHRGPYFAHALPIAFQTVILLSVFILGSYFNKQTEVQTVVITTSLLFSVGLQNGAVSVISSQGIKTSHLTGLLTDLGTDISEWYHPKVERTIALRDKLQLRISIFALYIFGAAVSGLLFMEIEFMNFAVIAGILLLILLYDAVHIKNATSA